MSGDEIKAKLRMIYEYKIGAQAIKHIEELEAKLAKAVEVAEKSIKWLRLYGADVHREATTLAELKGEK